MKKNHCEAVSETLLKGRLTELQCIQKFLSMGYIVSVPEVPCQYDIVLDVGKRMLKVQIKTCHLSQDGAVIIFKTSSITHNNNGYTERVYTNNMVDYFCTYYDDNCYLVPFSQCGSSEKKLRLIPLGNGQIKNIAFAEDYLAEKIIADL